MSILGRLSQYARNYKDRRERMWTYLQVSSLPHEMQKDIGWPDIDSRRSSKR